ncbi:Na+/H+ antiporter subunit E [Tropicibacter naphthalenivorans]|uniref:Mrp complex subunit E1 n=1 Tax=Tropicibacter naphthalenivorans TaxID=441103 RepID=A0A0P1GHA5_9RHOB|nr:Na+/H+ antiporter subunit E [Tropicibacter naphthalenivorans]CUH81074.1 Mrp complex subunit E1 [Tropicibacter naphthalenivorans]SMC97000.1 multisubunit potassium/proton antiporter, PhaE subunit [Tropicibacter naphthalenivorans]
MLKRIFPHPLLSLLLLIVWTMLVNKVTLGNLLLGVIIGIALPIMTAAYWPERALIKSPLKVVSYIALVVWDIVVANVQVALIILFKPTSKINSQWVTVPLELTSPEAITVLAGTITMTPGTVTALLSADGGSLLVHCLHTDDPQGEIDGIKTRYEARLKEIFA